jgi:hypothetical protein
LQKHMHKQKQHHETKRSLDFFKNDMLMCSYSRLMCLYVSIKEGCLFVLFVMLRFLQLLRCPLIMLSLLLRKKALNKSGCTHVVW